MRRQKKNPFHHGMSVKDIYPMLESPGPGFLKRDVARYTKSNGRYTDALGELSGAQRLGLKMVQLHVLPHSRQRILDKAKHPLKRLTKKRNWSQISLPIQHQKSQN